MILRVDGLATTDQQSLNDADASRGARTAYFLVTGGLALSTDHAALSALLAESFALFAASPALFADRVAASLAAAAFIAAAFPLAAFPTAALFAAFIAAMLASRAAWLAEFAAELATAALTSVVSAGLSHAESDMRESDAVVIRAIRVTFGMDNPFEAPRRNLRPRYDGEV